MINALLKGWGRDQCEGVLDREAFLNESVFNQDLEGVMGRDEQVEPGTFLTEEA